jgi:hypothetical protein
MGEQYSGYPTKEWIMIPAITLILLSLFMYFGHDAHWFDVVVLGTRDGSINVQAEIRANVALAALIAWTMRNDLISLWSFRRGADS